MKRKAMILLLVCTLALVFTACQKKPADAPTQPEATQESETETSGEAESQEEKPESSITGTLVDAAMSTLIVETDSGEEYIFAKENPDITGLKDGLTIGDRITLTYTGTIDGTDTTDVDVIAIADAAE